MPNNVHKKESHDMVLAISQDCNQFCRNNWTFNNVHLQPCCHRRSIESLPLFLFLIPPNQTIIFKLQCDYLNHSSSFLSWRHHCNTFLFYSQSVFSVFQASEYGTILFYSLTYVHILSLSLSLSLFFCVLWWLIIRKLLQKETFLLNFHSPNSFLKGFFFLSFLL